MPFSLIAIILVLLSSISAALITDLGEKSDGVELTVEGLERNGRALAGGSGQC